MSARSGQLIPSKISNIRLVEKLEEWGFVRAKTRGDFILMGHSDGREVTVMAPHIHRGNSTEELRQVYRVVCNGDAATFWSYKKPTKLTPVPTPAPTPDPDPESLEKRNTAMLRGLASCVLEYVQSKPHDTHTIKSVAAAIKVVPGPVGNAMSYLHSQGHLVRVLRGTYRLSPTLQAESTVHHAHTGPVGVEVRGVPAAPASTAPAVPPVVPAPAPRPASVPPVPPAAPAPVPAPVHSDDDDLDALLELVLPDHYIFQPKHIKAMREWQNATAKLLRTLRGEE